MKDKIQAVITKAGWELTRAQLGDFNCEIGNECYDDCVAARREHEEEACRFILRAVLEVVRESGVEGALEAAKSHLNECSNSGDKDAWDALQTARAALTRANKENEELKRRVGELEGELLDYREAFSASKASGGLLGTTTVKVKDVLAANEKVRALRALLVEAQAALEAAKSALGGVDDAGNYEYPQTLPVVERALIRINDAIEKNGIYEPITFHEDGTATFRYRRIVPATGLGSYKGPVGTDSTDERVAAGMSGGEPTPRTDAVARRIGAVAAQWRDCKITAAQFTEARESFFDDLRIVERECSRLQQALQRAEEVRKQLAGALQKIASFGKVYTAPVDWDYPGMGGGPELSDCEAHDIADIASEPLAASDALDNEGGPQK